MTKDELIDAHRYINVEDEYWADEIVEDFIFRMYQLGICLEAGDIEWSGFCSQGDGARFVCNDFDWDLFAKKHDLYDGSPWLEAAFKAGADPYIKMWSGDSRYCHECTVYAELLFNNEVQDALPYDLDEGDVRLAAAKVIQDQIELHCDAEFDKDITEILRGYMKELYRELDKLFYTLIEDDAVWESLEVNYPDIIEEDLDPDGDV